MATPTFSTMPDVYMPRSTWPDVGRHRGHTMAAIQTGRGNNRCRATFGHVVSGTSEYRASLQMWGQTLRARRHLFPFKSYFYFRFASSPFCISHVGRCRVMSLVAYLSRAWSKMWGWPLKSRRHIFPFKCYFNFRFPVSHFEFRQSPSSRPWSMLGLSKAMISRHDQMLIHDVPAKNSATWK